MQNSYVRMLTPSCTFSSKAMAIFPAFSLVDWVTVAVVVAIVMFISELTMKVRSSRPKAKGIKYKTVEDWCLVKTWKNSQDIETLS